MFGVLPYTICHVREHVFNKAKNDCRYSREIATGQSCASNKPFKKLFDAVGQKLGIANLNQVRFIYDGERLLET